MATPRELMRQKINVSPTLIEYYEKMYDLSVRNLINKWLLKKEDRGTTFEYKGRIFTIVGMTENEHCILSEIIDGTTVYWECTAHFVQYSLRRFYTEWIKMPNGKYMDRAKIYENSKLHLPLHKSRRKKKEEAEELVVEEEFQLESYFEDVYEDDFSED